MKLETLCLAAMVAALSQMPSVQAQQAGSKQIGAGQNQPGQPGGAAQSSDSDKSTGADLTGKASRSDTPSSTGSQTELGQSSTSSRYGALAGKIQKGSDLIGKEVRNAQSEKLGEIKDFAVDLQSGRIAYVVLSREGTSGPPGAQAGPTAPVGPGIGSQMVAVPTALLSKTAGQDFITLNTSKQQLESMPGFTGDNWPNQLPSAWGAGLLNKSGDFNRDRSTTPGQRTIPGESTTPGQGNSSGHSDNPGYHQGKQDHTREQKSKD